MKSMYRVQIINQQNEHAASDLLDGLHLSFNLRTPARRKKLMRQIKVGAARTTQVRHARIGHTCENELERVTRERNA